MQRFQFLKRRAVIAVPLLLSGCGDKTAELKVGATAGPHARMFKGRRSS